MGDLIDPAALNAEIATKADQTDLDATQAHLENLQENVQALQESAVVATTSEVFGTSPEVSLAIRMGNFPWTPAEFTGWVFAWMPQKPMVLGSIAPLISVGSGTASMELKFYRRRLENSESTLGFGSIATDELLYQRTVAPAEFADAVGVFKHVELSLVEAGTIYPGYIYAVDLTARTSGGSLGQVASGALGVSAGLAQWERGWYKNLAGGSVPVSSISRLVFRLNELTAKTLDIIQGEVAALSESFLSRRDGLAVDTGYAGRHPLSSNFRGVQIGVQFEQEVIATRAILPFRVAANAAFIYARVYRRSATYSGSAAFGGDADDAVVFDEVLSLAEAGLTADVDGAITIDLSALPVLRPEYRYGFEFAAKTSALDSAVLAMGFVGRSTTDPQWSKGYYTTATGNPSWSPFSPTSGLSFRLEKLAYEPASSPSAAIAPVAVSPDLNIRVISGFSVNIPAMRVLRPSGPISVAQTVATFDQPASVVRTGTHNLAQLPSAGIVPVLPTGDQYLSSVTLTRVSDGVPLVAGTDYVAYFDQGAFGLPGAGAAVPVSYSAVASAQRYDIVSLDPATKNVVVTKGTDRYTRDPEYYRAGVPAGNIPLYTAYVTRYGVDLIPVMHHRKFVRSDRKADVAAWRAYCRSCLPATMKKLLTGSPLKVLGYGDSITAIGGGQVEPDGATRDLVSWLSGMAADTKALFPVYDGPAGVGAHLQIGWNWVLKKALEKRYASAITYLNFGWGGTTSADTGDNGLSPTRLNRVLAEGPALLTLAFGMNELGSSTTYANVVNIIGQARAVGMEVLVITPPRCNEVGRPTVLAAWKKTHDDLVQAALDTGSAYLSTYELSGEGFQGATGRSPKNMCTQNLYNHPWPMELSEIGQLMTSIFE
ncbi:SGNH/GDSL hydrolase family protein [Ensifer sp. M14]|uniref:SGNH/GDSL hydrolase family protein n=1 Tax=Ensifer sp. M14 TaxID=2203782 RepID=UPI000E1E2B59|nr:SGNH/GDSL hydrolase family protein [Ensifer sp. M14]